MYKCVRGRVDASRKWGVEASHKWGEHVKEVIFKDLGLLPAVYSGIFQGHPIILGQAKHKATYKATVAVFETRWTIHTLGLVNTFFGLRFVSSKDCITIDQTVKTETIITAFFGPSLKAQPPSSSCSIPMKPGTAYAESLAHALPLDEAGMAQVKAEFGFEFCSTHSPHELYASGSLDAIGIIYYMELFTTWLVLAQYQNEPSHIDFAAVKKVVGYLHLHPDLPLTFDCSCFLNTVGSFDLEIDHLDPFKIQFLDPETYLVASVQLLCADHAASNLKCFPIHRPKPVPQMQLQTKLHHTLILTLKHFTQKALLMLIFLEVSSKRFRILALLSPCLVLVCFPSIENVILLPKTPLKQK
jgi:hypothetical protein